MHNYIKRWLLCTVTLLWCCCAVAQSNISRVEYYIDTDPGFGKATAVTITAGTTLSNLAININLTSLSVGVHVVGLRALTASGKWSLDNTWLFIKPATAAAQPNISRVEYFIDTDPGYGKATAVTIAAGNILTAVAIPVNPTTLTTGVHIIGLRALDANGKWSLDNTWLFIKPATVATQPKLSRVEYFIDNDPGYGKATAVGSPTDTVLNAVAIPINPTALSTGVHLIGLRALDANGKWSLDDNWLFMKPAAAAVRANLSRVEYFIDTDPGYGKATAVTIAADSIINNIAIPINPTALSKGVHVVGLRALDANGKWSLDNIWLFITPAAVPAQPNLAKVEYYIDNDPGYGKGVPVAFNPATQLPNLSLPVNVTGLTAGAHVLIIRSLDATGHWALDDTLNFKLPTVLVAPSIVVNSITNTTVCVNGSVKIAYQVTGKYNAGNVFTAQLSDSTGSFANPVAIGHITDTLSNIINCTLPGILPAGSKYKVRVSSSSPVVSNQVTIGSLILTPKPVPVSIIGDSAVNVHFSYPDSVKAVSGLAYAWSVKGGAITASNNNTATVRWDSIGQPEKLQIIQTNQYTCTDTSIKLVNVYPLRIDSVTVSTVTPCPSSGITVGAKVTGAYGTGNVFTAQLSDTAGNFAAPVNIGSVATSPKGALIQVNIPVHLPYPLPNGIHYRIRVTGSLPADTSVLYSPYMQIQKPNLGKDTTVFTCPGSAVNLTKVYNTLGLTASFAVARPDSVTILGAYTIVVTNSNGCKDTAVITLSNHAKPNLGKDSTVYTCLGTAVNIKTVYNTTAYTSVLWSTARPDSITVAGAYTVIVSNSSGCKDTAISTVADYPKPNLGKDTTLYTCLGTAVNIKNLYNTAGYATVTWSTARPDSVTAAGTYTLTVTNSNGCKDTAVVKVINYGKPNLGKDTTVSTCLGTAINIKTVYNTTAYTTVTWSTARPDSITTAGAYTVTATNSNGCKDTAVVTVSNYPKPNLGKDTLVNTCLGTAVNIKKLYSTTGLTTLWSTARPDSITLAGKYTLTVTNGNGCMDTAVVTVSNYPKPNLGKDTAVSVCAGIAINIKNLYNTTGYTGAVWNTARPDSVVLAGNYTLTVTNSNGCKDTAVVKVTNPALPPVPVITKTGNTTFCLSDSLVLTANASAGLQWYRDNGAIKQATASRYVVKLSGNYKLKVTGAGGCSVTSDSVVVTVIQVPVPTITLVNDTLVSSAATGNQWFEDGMLIPGATGNKYSPVNIDEYTVGATSGGCESSMSSPYLYMAGTSGIRGKKHVADNVKILLYPNPAQDVANLQLSGLTGGVIVAITDMAGKVVWQHDKLTNSTYTLPLSNLASGLYIVTVKDEIAIRTLKLVKAK